MSITNQSKWTKSEKIAVFALLVSLISVSFTGLTYLSNESGKRADLSVLLTKTQFSLVVQNVSDFPLLATFSIAGVISNEGPRLCQATNFTIVITLPISDELRQRYNVSSNVAYIDYQQPHIFGTVNDLGWNDTYFESKSEKQFNINFYAELDNSYSNLSNSKISDCYLKIIYDDGIGVLEKQQPLTGWSKIQ